MSGNRSPLSFSRSSRANEVHQVGGVLAVEDRECRIHAAALRVLAQQSRADAVEGPGPRQRRMRDARPPFAEPRHDAFHAPGHLDRRAARKRQQEDRARIDAIGHQAGHAMRERVGLAGSRAGDDQQRAAVRAVEPVARGRALVRIETGEEAIDSGRGWIDRKRRGGRGGHGDGERGLVFHTVHDFRRRIGRSRADRVCAAKLRLAGRGRTGDRSGALS